jgi:hypothetical protein
VTSTTRAEFVSRSVKGGLVLAVAGATVGSFAGAAGAASKASGPLADLDLALARLAVAAELLAIEFYNQAIASGKLQGGELDYLNRAQFNEQEHLMAMSGILSGAGQTPSTADDLTITFPKGTFDSRMAIAQFGVALETGFTGTYLGAVNDFGPPDLKTAAARIAASESQHLSVFSNITAGRPVGVSFPATIDYAAASDALTPYLGTAGF